MTSVPLDGCATAPLGSYLAALGLLRAVTRTVDPDAAGHWQRRRFVLDSRYATVEHLVDDLHEHFTPEAIVSPWNAGSGFAGNGKNSTAEAALADVRASTDPRLEVLRVAVRAGDKVVEIGRDKGWGGSGDKLWDEKHKQDVLSLCRSKFPDDALPWLDAAVALNSDGDPAFSRLLGTGGNFGRQDLSVTYLGRARIALRDKRSRAWLTALLTGDESVPYLRDAVGQFDPGRAGGIQSSPFEKADDSGFANPWAFLFTVEGALLFATAMVRRHGAHYNEASLPFQVRGSTGGSPTWAPDEPTLGELWTPIWTKPTTVDEIAHLLAEGRAEWNSRPAATGLDFARAVANLGVDRGIAAFERHVFVSRLGQNPLAVPVGRMEVHRRRGVRELAPLDNWLARLRRVALPAGVASALRTLNAALYRHASTGAAADLVDVFAAVGRCHEAVARSGDVRRVVRPAVLRGANSLLRLLYDPIRDGDQPELRIALALASARTDGAPGALSLRSLLSPVTATRNPQWTDRPTPAPLSAGLCTALAEAARRRAFSANSSTAAQDPGSVIGVPLTFDRGLRVSRGDVLALLQGRLDDERIQDLLSGFMIVDWAGTADQYLSGPKESHPVVDLLTPFAEPRHATAQLPGGLTTTITPRPAATWPAQLAAGQVDDVLADATRRLRIEGLLQVITPVPTAVDGVRLAATLLMRRGQPDISRAVQAISVPPEH
ncbi:CRISPR-associated protein Csx17 [Herbihabitans rhizosphaerae]|uniref:CRISPR-associated protein Csx17 n=1 Tax=Herbihabitans rhizosphaerae TaxID=1872711 RepID=A0A4Q7L5Z8_9PSEU|nr:type I-U CRISPR-associated protein Csx17 [Herbihabitans rhizosphaerae]RZS44714.1 CRISPR-associated protein Csx17 [Herbihabitans rhizosphaerae]